MRSICTLIVATLLLATSATRTTFAQEAIPDPGDVTIYVIAHASGTDPFWATQLRAVEDAGRHLGINVIFQGPERFSIARQVDLFEAALVAQPDGIAVTISDADAWVAPLERAAREGVPVVAFNVPDFQGRMQYLAYVGMDETVSGERVAERMLPLLESGDRVVVANHQPGLVVLEMRFDGIRRALEAEGIIVDALDVGEDPGTGAELLRSYFERNPDTAGIFTLGPLGSAAAGTFLRETGRVGTVAHGAIDLDPVVIDQIKAGITNFALDQQPYMQGYQAVQLLYLHVMFGLEPPDIDTGQAFITIDNVEAVEALVRAGVR